MKNVGIGDTHNDFLFVNDCLCCDSDHFSNLSIVENHYQLDSTKRYRQLLESADPTIDWRYRIARWMLRVVDEFMLKRDTALIALNYFDRLMMSESEVLQREKFQVAAITCLFVASKLFQKRPLKVSALVLYTKNAFQSEAILSMEQELLRTNKSYFFPVTSSTFVSIFLNGITVCEFPATMIAAIIESSQFLIELAACDFFFIAHRASRIAVAAIVVSLETQTMIKVKVSQEAVGYCLSNIKAKIDYTEDAASKACIQKLRSIHSQNEERIRDMENKSTDAEVVKYTTGREADPNASRAATPSPTDPCQCKTDSSPPKIVDEEHMYARKRRRSSQSIELV